MLGKFSKMCKVRVNYQLINECDYPAKIHVN